MFSPTEFIAEQHRAVSRLSTNSSVWGQRQPQTPTSRMRLHAGLQRESWKNKLAFESDMKGSSFCRLQTKSNDRAGRTLKLNVSRRSVEPGFYWQDFEVFVFRTLTFWASKVCVHHMEHLNYSPTQFHCWKIWLSLLRSSGKKWLSPRSTDHAPRKVAKMPNISVLQAQHALAVIKTLLPKASTMI